MKASTRKVRSERSSADPSRGGELRHKSGPQFLALTAIGVAFGDIGTTPLYTLQAALVATHHAEPTSADVLGIVSLIFWALMAMVSLKYVVLVLRADNDGEGGILALLLLVERITNGPGSPILVLLGMAGAALLYSGGAITPPLSVLSAMEGLKLVNVPSGSGVEAMQRLINPFVLPLTLAILIGLFMMQRRGTARLGRLFGPIMFTWFVVIALLGAINIYAAPAILKALSPLEAAHFILTNPFVTFAVTGGAFLALSGADSLYEDMGQVGSTAIRRAWFHLALPALLLNYFGQGALVLTDPKASDYPFYKLAPEWALIPLVGLATLATIIASQGVISGVFSLTKQAMQMGLCPRMRIVPTSSDEAGQIYVPTANWLLMVGALLIVALFKTSENLAPAYGIAVAGAMLVTTILLYRVAIGRWRWPPAVAIFIIVVFGAVDATFLASNLLKVVEAGWFPITVGSAIVGLMLCWRQGSWLVRHRLQEMSMPLQRFVDNIDEMVVARPPGVGVWLTKVAHGASPVLLHHVKHNRVLYETLILMTFVADRRPRVPVAERHSIEHLGHGIYCIQVRLGFMQTPDVPVALKSCKMRGFEIDLHQVHYYIAHEIVFRRAKGSAMAALPFAIYAFLARIASRAPDLFKIRHEQVLEVGFHIEI